MLCGSRKHVRPNVLRPRFGEDSFLHTGRRRQSAAAGHDDHRLFFRVVGVHRCDVHDFLVVDVAVAGVCHKRRRIDFAVDNLKRTADESFEIKLRNHKKEPVEIRVTEHLCRWRTWEIAAKSDPFTKIDAQTIEFRIAVEPDEEKVVSYKVHYTQLPAFNRQPVPGQ